VVRFQSILRFSCVIDGRGKLSGWVAGRSKRLGSFVERSEKMIGGVVCSAVLVRRLMNAEAFQSGSAPGVCLRLGCVDATSRLSCSNECSKRICNNEREN
jgi:hypothetical protein